MTNVQMLVHITGGRADGSVWPQVGHDKPLKVSQAEAEDLYRAQLARPWPGGDEVHEMPAEAAAAAQTETPAEASGAYGIPQALPDPEPEQEPDAAPRPAAPKADWVDWAVSQGATEDEANASTKQQLMEQYGARP